MPFSLPLRAIRLSGVRARLAGFVALVFLVGGCTSDGTPTSVAAAEPPTTNSDLLAVITTTTTAVTQPPTTNSDLLAVTTTTTTVVTQPPTNLDALALRGGGIGIAAFGDSTDAVIEAVEKLLGPADEDTGFVEQQILGFCGSSGRQRSVTWGNFHLGFTDQQNVDYSGFIAYVMSARDYVDDAWVTVEDPSPLLRLPHGVTVLDTEAEARTEFGENLSPMEDPLESGDELAFLDLGGPWPVILWFDEGQTDRITRIESSPCGD